MGMAFLFWVVENFPVHKRSKMWMVMGLTSTVSMGFIPLSYADVSALLSFLTPIELILLIGGDVLILFSIDCFISEGNGAEKS